MEPHEDVDYQENKEDPVAHTSPESVQNEPCCCTRGLSCLKQVFCSAWKFVFCKESKNGNTDWDDVQVTESSTDDSDAHQVDQSTSSIMHNNDKAETLHQVGSERITLKGSLSAIHKQQEKILQSIQSSSKKKGKLDVFNIDSTQSRNSGQALDDSGLPKRLIDSIVTTEYICSRMSKGESRRECPICTVSFEEGDAIKILQCLHTYHKDCVDTWLSKKSTCPDCKFNLRALDLKQFI